MLTRNHEVIFRVGNSGETIMISSPLNSLTDLTGTFTKSISLPVDMSKNFRMSGKRYRPRSDLALFGI